ncbi:hypothetical protein [Bradyrhizobium sp. AZCC 2230]|uniref:hypothetical protein n=1 Tax=Bradyrhizobium sp. AZCC 2230 TaxID=3117021 RepID=UPI002FF20092
MKRSTIFALVITVGLGSSPSMARAGDGGAIAAGVIGGLALGAIAGSAIADPNPPPSAIYEGDDYVTVYRARPRIRVYHYETVPPVGYRGYGRGYDVYEYGSWYD